MNDDKTSILDLIGKYFKRNKYGLSIWTDQITYIGHRYNIIDRNISKIEFLIKGTTDLWFSFDEIVIVNRKLNWIEEAQLHKRDIQESIRRGEIPDTKFRKNESN